MTLLKNGKERYKILIVEDDEIILSLTQNYLSKEFDIEVAVSGQDAIAAAINTKFDLILMDINLGTELSGVDVLKELKKNQHNSHIPFIAFTAFAMAGDKEEFLKNGFVNYISKPFTRSQLMEVIKESLKKI